MHERPPLDLGNLASAMGNMVASAADILRESAAEKRQSDPQEAIATGVNWQDARELLDPLLQAAKDQGISRLETGPQRLAFRASIDAIPDAFQTLLDAIQVAPLPKPGADLARESEQLHTKVMALIRLTQFFLCVLAFFFMFAGSTGLLFLVILLLASLEAAWVLLDPARKFRASLLETLLLPLRGSLLVKGLWFIGLAESFQQFLNKLGVADQNRKSAAKQFSVSILEPSVIEATNRLTGPISELIVSFDSPRTTQTSELPASVEELLQVIAGRMRDGDMNRLKKHLDYDFARVLKELNAVVIPTWSPSDDPLLWEVEIEEGITEPKVVRPALRRGHHLVRGMVFLPQGLGAQS